MKLQLEEELPQPLAAGTQEEYSIVGISAKTTTHGMNIKIRQAGRVFLIIRALESWGRPYFVVKPSTNTAISNTR